MVLIKIKKNNLELKYTIGSRQILINKNDILDPLQTNLFEACLEFVIKNVTRARRPIFFINLIFIYF